MTFRFPDFEIDPNNPYDHDKLSRKDCGDCLRNLVENVPGPLVLSLNGVVLKKIKASLRK